MNDAEKKPEQELDLSLDSEEVVNGPTPVDSKKSDKEDDGLHIDWSQAIPSKSKTGTYVVTDPNNFYLQNLQFLSGQKSATDKENVRRPIFRVGILLDSGKNSLAKAIHVPNSTNPAELENVPSDYYNILDPDNLDNLSVYFIDLVFEWTVDKDGHDWVKPVWVNTDRPTPFVTTADNEIKPREVKTMGCFHLRPYGKPKNNVIYTNNNPFCKEFWRRIISSYEFTEEAKSIYTETYTIWFQKKYFGYNVLEKIFKNYYTDQVKYFKDSCLNKKVLDLFELSDLISKNDMIAKKNNIFLLFTKWLNYKNTSMAASQDIYNKKSAAAAKTESITTDFFKRLDDLFYYVIKCFINILDQCLYENYINQMGSNGVLLEDFFKKDYAVGGTNQETDQEYIKFVDEDQENIKKVAKKSKKKTTKKKTKSSSTRRKSALRRGKRGR